MVQSSVFSLHDSLEFTDDDFGLDYGVEYSINKYGSVHESGELRFEHDSSFQSVNVFHSVFSLFRLHDSLDFTGDDLGEHDVDLVDGIEYAISKHGNELESGELRFEHDSSFRM